MPNNGLICIFFVLPIYKSNIIDSTRITGIFLAIFLELLNSQINVNFIFGYDELSKHILWLNSQCFIGPFNRLRRFYSFILEYISTIDIRSNQIRLELINLVIQFYCIIKIAEIVEDICIAYCYLVFIFIAIIHIFIPSAGIP